MTPGNVVKSFNLIVGHVSVSEKTPKVRVQDAIPALWLIEYSRRTGAP
jgi:hypothetical protein